MFIYVLKFFKENDTILSMICMVYKKKFNKMSTYNYFLSFIVFVYLEGVGII